MNNEIIEKLKDEQEELKNKSYRLFLFIKSEKFKLLVKQFSAMAKYNRILNLRIKDLGE